MPHVQLIIPHKRKADKVEKREESFKVKRVKKTVETLLGYYDGVVPDDDEELWERDIQDTIETLERSAAVVTLEPWERALIAAIDAPDRSSTSGSSTDPVQNSTIEPTSGDNPEPTGKPQVFGVDQTTNSSTG